MKTSISIEETSDLGGASPDCERFQTWCAKAVRLLATALFGGVVLFASDGGAQEVASRLNGNGTSEKSARPAPSVSISFPKVAARSTSESIPLERDSARLSSSLSSARNSSELLSRQPAQNLEEPLEFGPTLELPELGVGDIRDFATENDAIRREENTEIAENAENAVFANENGESDDAVVERVADVASSDESVAEFADENESGSGAAAIADECFFALDPYSSLFIEYEPTSAWTEEVLEYVDAILPLLEESPTEAAALTKRFRAKIAEADGTRAALIAAERSSAPFYSTVAANAYSENALENGADVGAQNGSEDAPELVSRYPLERRLELLETFRGALERRAFLWTRAADYFEAKNQNLLIPPTDFTVRDLEAIRRTTLAAQAFFGDSATGRNWRDSFEIDLLVADVGRMIEACRPTFTPVGSAKVATNFGVSKSNNFAESNADEQTRLAKFLRDRLNSVCYKIEKTPMTPDQRLVFQREPLAEWVATLAPFACDQTDASTLLLEFEEYERSGGGEIGRTLQQNARRMTTSRSEVCRRFGAAFDVVYDNPNVKAYVSEALINRLLPIRDPEFDVVQETVLNNPVAGRRRTDVQVYIELVPDPSRLTMNLNVSGRVLATTSSAVFPATLYNRSAATYFGRKALEWRDDGLAYSSASVAAESVNRLSAVETDVDFVPIVGDLAREVVRSQYEAKQGAIRSETKARVAREARTRIDLESNERFDALNQRLRQNFFADLERLNLSLRTQRSKTTDEWLLASLRLGSDFSLGCQSTEPPTLEGAFADFKAHESAVNAFLAQLELGGKTLTPQETVAYLAEKLQKPEINNVKIEENKLEFAFADSDPIVVRFFEDKIQLRLRFRELTLGATTWSDVAVAVSYRPQVAADGSATFVRDGVVELDGPLSIRAQIPLRAIFSKMFPAEKSFDLRPDVLKSDERFAGLALGLCRVSNGWFAISVVCPR